MIVIDVEQNTPEWHNVRLGIPTASSYDKIVTMTGARSKGREAYLYTLAGEKITGRRSIGFKNAHMDAGHEKEALSRSHYEIVNGVTVQQPGFCFFDEAMRYGCSPDGLVNDDGGFETKNADFKIHIPRVLKGWAVSEHHRQVLGCLHVCGRDWWDLVSFCEGLQPVVYRYYREHYKDFLIKLESELNYFCDDLEKLIKRLS